MNRLSRAALSLAVVLPSASALAAEPGHAPQRGEHHAPHIENLWGVGAEYAHAPALGWLTVTFLIFAGFLVWVLRPRINNLLEGRAHDVRKAIEEAKRAKEEAEARARDAEQKLAALEGETRRLRADFEVQGKAELARIEKLAEETASRIAKDAEDTIAAETERAQQQLRSEAARLALELAEERIRAALSGEDDVRLQRSLVAGLAASDKNAPSA